MKNNTKVQNKSKAKKDGSAILSMSASAGYHLAKAAASSPESYNPQYVDDWYAERTKEALDFANSILKKHHA